MKKESEKQIVPRRSKRRFVSNTFCPVCGEGISDVVELRQIPSLLGIPERKIGEMIDFGKVRAGYHRKGLELECLVDLRSLKRIPARVHKTMTHIM